MNALIRACELGDIAQVNQLLKEGVIDPGAEDNQAIRSAAEKGHLEVIERLLQEKRVDAIADCNHAIQAAAVKGHLEVVKRLLKVKGAEATYLDNKLICIAAQYGQLEVVKYLSKLEGVDAAARDSHAIRFAVNNGHLEVVKCLLPVHGVDITAENNFAIVTAKTMSVYENKFKIILELLCETLRLQILADFYNSVIAKDIFASALNVETFMLEFENAVNARMGDISKIKKIVAEKIIKRTADSLMLAIQLFNSDAAETLPEALINIVVEYNEALLEPTPSENNDTENTFDKFEVTHERKKNLYLLNLHLLRLAAFEKNKTSVTKEQVQTYRPN